MDISAHLLEPLRALGAVHFSIAMNFVSDRDLRVYCDYPAEWQERYFKEALYLKDPVFLAAPGLRGATPWSEIALPGADDAVLEQARECGVQNGFSVPVWLAGEEHVVSITLDNIKIPSPSHGDAITREARRLIALLAELPGPGVSRLQSRVYFLASQGLKPSEIVRILRDRVDCVSIADVPPDFETRMN